VSRGCQRLKRESELHDRLGEAMIKLGREREAEQHHRTALTLAERSAAANPTDEAREQVASASLNLARMLEHTKPGTGLPFSNKATAIDEELARRNPGDLTILRELSVAYGEQGRSYYLTNQLSQSLKQYERAIALR
jgi:hypothetical protein